MVLVQELGCMLPVDLYDTTGEQDVHLNKELLDFAANVHSKKNGTGQLLFSCSADCIVLLLVKCSICCQ